MHHLSFPPFRLDPASEQLWRGAELLPLRPKAFLLLRYLAEHAERLVSQEELLNAVWQHSHVSDGLVRGYIRELRQVLGDDAKAPRFIETASAVCRARRAVLRYRARDFARLSAQPLDGSAVFANLG